MQLRPPDGYNEAMPRAAARVPGIERLELPEVRQAIPRLHAYLRECILDGRLPPGTKLSQVALAEQLGVSRTPLREVLRMLQEEGYVEFEPNQRMRVADLDPVELDADYACRIVLETLGLSMTLETIGSRQRREARRLLTAMRRAARVGDFPGWFGAHHAYHRVLTAGAGEPLLRQLQSLEDRSVRYIRIYQQSEPASWQTAGDTEHAAILDALAAGDDHAALAGLAHHLARTALRVLSDCAPGYAPRAVPHAVALAEGADPVALRAASVG
jgi:DNA-binding GntR family transcriptional regulator